MSINKRRAFAAAAILSCPVIPAHSQTQFNLPEGPGKTLVSGLCNACHPASRVEEGLPQAYWHTTVRMMMNFGAPVKPDDYFTIVDYLSNNFPERPKPLANEIAGPVKIVIREWQVPTIGSRPTTRWPRATARSGTPGSSATKSAASIPRRGRSANTR